MRNTRRLSFTFSSVGLGVLAFFIACSTQTHLPVDAHPSNSTNGQPVSETSPASGLPLKVVTDIPLTGGATRLDYQSLDSSNGRLYIAHLGSCRNRKSNYRSHCRGFITTHECDRRSGLARLFQLWCQPRSVCVGVAQDWHS